MNYSRFTSMVDLEAFSPFKSSVNALGSVTEGNMYM